MTSAITYIFDSRTIQHFNFTYIKYYEIIYLLMTLKNSKINNTFVQCFIYVNKYYFTTIVSYFHFNGLFGYTISVASCTLQSFILLINFVVLFVYPYVYISFALSEIFVFSINLDKNDFIWNQLIRPKLIRSFPIVCRSWFFKNI